MLRVRYETHLDTLVALVVGLMVACSSDPAATSTPNYPQISADETVDSLKQILEGFDKAIQIDPNDDEAYFARGSVYGDLGQYQTAINDFDRVTQIDPDIASTYYGQGLAYSGLGQHRNADAEFAKACSLDSQYC